MTYFVPFEVFFTLPLCGLSFILACVAIITQNWVSGREEAVGRKISQNLKISAYHLKIQ